MPKTSKNAKFIGFRVSPETYKSIDNKALDVGMTISDYCRDVLLDKEGARMLARNSRLIDKMGDYMSDYKHFRKVVSDRQIEILRRVRVLTQLQIKLMEYFAKKFDTELINQKIFNEMTNEATKRYPPEYRSEIGNELDNSLRDMRLPLIPEPTKASKEETKSPMSAIEYKNEIKQIIIDCIKVGLKEEQMKNALKEIMAPNEAEKLIQKIIASQ